MVAENNTGETKVTLAVLAHKIDSLNSSVREQTAAIQHHLEQLEARVRCNEQSLTALDQRAMRNRDDIEEYKDDLDGLKTRDTIWGGVNSLLGLIAGILGISNR